MKSYITIVLLVLVVLGCSVTLTQPPFYFTFVHAKPPPVNPPKCIYAAITIVGLFIGVSNYKDDTIPGNLDLNREGDGQNGT